MKAGATMKTLIRTLHGENGNLYCVSDGRRVLLAICRPCIRIYEHTQNMKTIDSQTVRLKTTHLSVAVCADREMTRDIDAGFLRTVQRFEFTGDFQREDGVFERIRFDSVSPYELDLSGDWEFEVIGQQELNQRLLRL